MIVSTRPRRRLDRIRRPQILATAVELLREKGIWSVRIADIAQRARQAWPFHRGGDGPSRSAN